MDRYIVFFFVVVVVDVTPAAPSLIMANGGR